MESIVTAPLQTAFVAAAPEKIAETPGRLVVFVEAAPPSTPSPAASTG